MKPPLFERVPFVGASSLAVREFRLPAFRHPWHQHPEVELTWILRGDGLRYVGDSVEPFHAGDFCLIGAHVPHAWLSSARVRGGVRSFVVQFNPERWGDDFLGLPECAALRGLLDRARRGLQFGPDVAGRYRDRLRSAACPVSRLATVLEVLDDLARVPARPLALVPWSSTQRGTDTRRIARVLAHVGRRVTESISHREAAAVAGLSPSAFSRFFRRSVGRTFQAYVSELRLSEACRQLVETDRSIAEIAFASGFGNLSNFNRAFRASRGISPRVFRQQVQARVLT